VDKARRVLSAVHDHPHTDTGSIIGVGWEDLGEVFLGAACGG